MNYVDKIFEGMNHEQRVKKWEQILGCKMEDISIIDCGGYTDPASFCSKCGELWAKDRYCRNYGKRNV